MPNDTGFASFERELNRLVESFSQRLAELKQPGYAEAHRHFHKCLNRPGNGGRENLRIFMRHWTASWLHREFPAFYKRLPASFANGRRLPAATPGRPSHIGH